MALFGVVHGVLLLWFLGALVNGQSLSNLSTTSTTSISTITTSTISLIPTDTTSTTVTDTSSSTITLSLTSSTIVPITTTSTSVSISTISKSTPASSTSIAPVVLTSSSAISSISSAISSLASSLSSLTADTTKTSSSSASVYTTTPPPTTFTTSTSSVVLSTSTYLSTYVAPVSTAPNGSPSFTTITSVVTGVSSSTTVLQLTSASTPGAALATSSAGGPHSGLSTGAKAGIGVGAAIIAIGAIALAVWLSMCCRKRRRTSISESDRYPPTPVPAMMTYAPAKKQPSELSSTPPTSPARRTPVPVSPQHTRSWNSGSVSEMYQNPIHEEQERPVPVYQSPTLGPDGYWNAQELPAGASGPPQGVYRGTEMEVPLHQQSSRPIVPKGVWPPNA